MLFEEVSQEIYEAKLVYARKGRTIIRKSLVKLLQITL